MLYDANGAPIFEGGITLDEVRAAIQAATMAEEWPLAEEIADRYGLKGVCLKCAIRAAVTGHHPKNLGTWRVCMPCFNELNRDFTFHDGVRAYINGLVNRDVQ